MRDPIYLDHNASTLILPEALDALSRAVRDGFANPSSSHAYGKRARAFVDEARAQLAALIGASPDEIVFTSGGTESNNLAIRGVLDEPLPAPGAPTTNRRRPRALTSDVEHPATLRTLAATGADVVRAPVDDEGRTQLADVAHALDLPGTATALVTMIHAQNETGVLQPVAQIAALLRQANAARERALFHVDGAQSVGKVRVNVDELGVDLLSIAGHKLGAPKGVGALYVRRSARDRVHPVSFGAGHERGMRPGTENVGAIAALGAACAVAAASVDAEGARQRALRDRLEAKLKERVPGLALNGHREHRLPNTLNVRFPAVSGIALLEACPAVAASTGSACHDGAETASAILLAMGIPAHEALGAVRLTLGRTTTESDVDEAARALADAWAELRA